MRCQRLYTVLTLLAIVSLTGCTQKPESTSASAQQDQAEVEAIRHVFEQFDSTANAGQAEEWMSLLTEDVIWMIPNQTSLVGKQAVRGRVEPFFANLNMHHVTNVDEVRVAGKWAYMRGTYNFRFAQKAGGAPTDDAGKIVYLLERQPDKTWRITRAIWNTDRQNP